MGWNQPLRDQINFYQFWDQCKCGKKIFCILGEGRGKMPWNQPLKPSSAWTPGTNAYQWLNREKGCICLFEFGKCCNQILLTRDSMWNSRFHGKKSLLFMSDVMLWGNASQWLNREKGCTVLLYYKIRYRRWIGPSSNRWCGEWMPSLGVSI